LPIKISNCHPADALRYHAAPAVVFPGTAVELRECQAQCAHHLQAQRLRLAVLGLNQGGPVVGLLAHQYACPQATTLAPGDGMVAYTDGESESMNRADKEWGEERMMEAAENYAGLAAVEMIRRIISAVDALAASAERPVATSRSRHGRRVSQLG